MLLHSKCNKHPVTICVWFHQALSNTLWAKSISSLNPWHFWQGGDLCLSVVICTPHQMMKHVLSNLRSSKHILWIVPIEMQPGICIQCGRYTCNLGETHASWGSTCNVGGTHATLGKHTQAGGAHATWEVHMQPWGKTRKLGEHMRRGRYTCNLWGRLVRWG